ncbi:MAG: pirin family protein [Vibrio sp.]
MSQSNFRSVYTVMQSQPTSDGDGVKIRRVAGFNHKHFSPFLMIDELKADDKKDYVGGFPPHPHRGIETLTYMLNGHFQHKDHMGNVGELRSGGAQWMAAGQGVIHSEMPIMQNGQLHGFQIWINQPAKDKMKPAKYFDFQPETITVKTFSEQNQIKVIAGNLNVNGEKLQGPLTDTGVFATVADWKAQDTSQLSFEVNQQHNALIYVYQGEVSIVDETKTDKEIKRLRTADLAVLPKSDHSDADSKQTDQIVLQASKDAGVLIFVGEPIDEPVVHYGPFVMNSMDEINQTIDDYQSGKFHQY